MGYREGFDWHRDIVPIEIAENTRLEGWDWSVVGTLGVGTHVAIAIREFGKDEVIWIAIFVEGVEIVWIINDRVSGIMESFP